jgi:hypothetical protein
MVDHAKVYTTEMLEGIQTSCGLRVTELLDAFDYVSDIL